MINSLQLFESLFVQHRHSRRFSRRLLLPLCFALFYGWVGCAHAVSPPDSQASEPYAVSAQPSADFVCPRDSKISAIACFLNAVEHLYTVCRQVKSIELIEFGFAQAEEGPNSLKSEFCRRKQKASLPAYLNAAQREAQVMSSCDAVYILNDLYTVWSAAMIGLRLRPNETEAEYQQRIAAPYLSFSAYRQRIHDALADAYQQPIQNCPLPVAYQP
ncbi:MAG: hypothetical protein FWC38_08890 [Proteobacteria bacterium]|nr:hypothetical protein [Pseudomonadota bacterium]MCL2308315.1 hypothetical protein [Pseudomonadota bacterium]